MNKPLKLKFAYHQLALTLAKYKYSPFENDVLAGKVLGIERLQGVVNLGLSCAGFLPKAEIFMNPSLSLKEYFKVNYIGEFLIVKLNDFRIILSLRRLHQNRLWERLRQIHASYMILYPKTEKSTWGGKILDFDGMKLFTPNSHIPKFFRRDQRSNILTPVTLLKIKRKLGKIKIIGSTRFAYVKKQSLFLEVEMIHHGCVDSMKRFGIFISILGVKCLLHISEISNKKITNIRTTHRKGNKLKVAIIYINRSKGQIALSAKKFSNSSTTAHNRNNF